MLSGLLERDRQSLTDDDRRALDTPIRDTEALWSLAATVLLFVAAVVTIFIDIWVGGPLREIDLRLAERRIDRSSIFFWPASVVDHIGLRGLTAPILAGTGLWLGRRTGQWRPLVTAVGSIVALNVVVGALKILAGRGAPYEAVPEVFVGGMMWPSGHSANIAATTLLMVYLLRAYDNRRLRPGAAVIAVGLPCAAMVVVSVLLGYHWFTDLVAGIFVGWIVALVAIGWDHHHRTRFRRPTWL